MTDLLRSADRAAIHWLHKRVRQGCEILGASPYIKLLLEREGQSSEPLKIDRYRGSGEEDE